MEQAERDGAERRGAAAARRGAVACAVYSDRARGASDRSRVRALSVRCRLTIIRISPYAEKSRDRVLSDHVHRIAQRTALSQGAQADFRLYHLIALFLFMPLSPPPRCSSAAQHTLRVPPLPQPPIQLLYLSCFLLSVSSALTDSALLYSVLIPNTRLSRIQDGMSTEYKTTRIQDFPPRDVIQAHCSVI